jgi:hypothetical protein
MDHISYKFLQRLPKNRKLMAELRQAAAVVHETIKALKKRQTISLGDGEPLDPLHTVYIAVQHAASVFAERVSVLDEFEPYYEIVLSSSFAHSGGVSGAARPVIFDRSVARHATTLL